MIKKKVMESSAIISKSRHCANMTARKLLYYALVYPYPTYCTIVWGNTYKTKIQRLISIQKKIMRLITFKPYLEHTEKFFKNLQILKVEQINFYLIYIYLCFIIN